MPKSCLTNWVHHGHQHFAFILLKNMFMAQFLTLDSQLLYKIGLTKALSLSMLGKCFKATKSTCSSVHCRSSSSTSLHKKCKINVTSVHLTILQHMKQKRFLIKNTNLSWNKRKASWAQILINPSTASVSNGFKASKIPLTQRVISRGE